MVNKVDYIGPVVGRQFLPSNSENPAKRSSAKLYVCGRCLL